jgi:hypothetical protein
MQVDSIAMVQHLEVLPGDRQRLGCTRGEQRSKTTPLTAHFIMGITRRHR